MRSPARTAVLLSAFVVLSSSLGHGPWALGLAQSLGLTQDPPPRILLDQPARAIEYQLARLTNDELSRVERKDDDVRYRPVYFALLTRKGMPRQFTEEALKALAKLDKTTPSAILLEGLGKVPTGESLTVARLIAALVAQPAATLRQERDRVVQAIRPSSPSLVQRGAYGALLVADGDVEPAWQLAQGSPGLVLEFLRSVPHLPSAGNPGPLGDQLFAKIAPLTGEGQDSDTRIAAIEALPWTRRDAGTFGVLAGELLKGDGEATRVAAARSLLLMPESAWPKEIEPLARAVVAWVGGVDPQRRTEPEILDAVQLGEKLAAMLPADAARAVRRELRALTVRVIRIEALPEQLLFDVKWFVVEAGKPAQIILSNPDAMPHNLVVGQPGSLKEIGTLAGGMAQSADPGAKSFVPESPLVLQATRLVQTGETERLAFTAPSTPGEYVYVCTFPGHWLRMYGVMLVVPDLEAWEAKPTVPTDPMTGAPFASRRN